MEMIEKRKRERRGPQDLKNARASHGQASGRRILQENQRYLQRRQEPRGGLVNRAVPLANNEWITGSLAEDAHRMHNDGDRPLHSKGAADGWV